MVQPMGPCSSIEGLKEHPIEHIVHADGDIGKAASRWMTKFWIAGNGLPHWSYRPDLPITIASSDLVVADTITHMSRDTYVYRVIRRCLS